MSCSDNPPVISSVLYSPHFFCVLLACLSVSLVLFSASFRTQQCSCVEFFAHPQKTVRYRTKPHEVRVIYQFLFRTPSSSIPHHSKQSLYFFLLSSVRNEPWKFPEISHAFGCFGYFAKQAFPMWTPAHSSLSSLVSTNNYRQWQNKHSHADQGPPCVFRMGNGHLSRERSMLTKIVECGSVLNLMLFDVIR